MPVLSKHERVLPCILTEEEIADRQDQLVRETKARELREESLRVWKAKKADEQKSYEADISHVARECFRLAGIIEKGVEPRTVDCEEVLADTGAEVTIFRLDTGEVVSMRVATTDELQRRLEFDQAQGGFPGENQADLDDFPPAGEGEEDAGHEDGLQSEAPLAEDKDYEP